VLLTGSGDEFCDPLPALLQGVAYHLPTVFLSFQHLFTDILHRDELLASPPFPVQFQRSCPFCCALDYSLLFIVQGFFLGGDSVCPGGCAGLSWGWLVEYCVMLGAHLFGLPNVSQARLEPAAAAAAYLFSQYNIAWRSFPWARDSGCTSFDSH
jgi:hypothetical protein